MLVLASGRARPLLTPQASEALGTIFVSFCPPCKLRSATSETCIEPLDLLIGPRHPFTLLFHLLLYLQVLPHPHLSIIMTQPWGGSKSVAKDADGMGAVMVEGVMVRGSWERRPRELGGGTGGGPWDGQEQQASLWRGKDSLRKGWEGRSGP